MFKLAACIFFAIAPVTVMANDWVIGDVSIVEDYTSFSPVYGVLINLVNKTYYNGSSPVITTCTQKFRVVVGLEGVTSEVQKNIFALALAANLSGKKLRLYVDSNAAYDGGYCAVQIASIGDF